MRHARADGLAVIASLTELGQALHYEVTQEHVVGATAAVDVSWTAAQHSDVPLFVFEVESSASAAMANNALKVLGAPNERLLKPLFFFHLVLSGTPSNERVANLQHHWGQHNYRVYRIAELDERRRLVSDVLLQHRRINQHVIVRQLAAALEAPSWALESVDHVLQEIESLGFLSNYLRDYALLAMQDESYLAAYCRRVSELRALDGQDRWHVVDSYGGSGGYLPGLLEVSLLIYAGRLTDAEGPAALEVFQESTGSQRMIGAYFGLSRDYDIFVLRVAPLHYAVSACLLRKSPDSFAWLVSDLHRLLADVAASGVGALDRSPMAHWLAHMAAAAPRRDSAAESAYATAQDVLLDAGGVKRDQVNDPYTPMDAEASMPEVIDGSPLPPASRLHEQVLASLRPWQVRDVHSLALALLTDDEWPRIGGAAIVARLHGG